MKPNIATQGMNCYVGYPGGSFGYGSGTSFASPINAGMMACLWQAKPNFNQSVLRMVIQQSASQFTHPDSLLGYGIPDYSYALLLTSAGTRGKSSCMAYPNPFTDAFKISFDGNTTGTAEITLFSLTGDIVLRTNRLVNTEAGDSITINDLVNLAPGMYIIRITSGNNTEYLHLVKVAK